MGLVTIVRRRRTPVRKVQSEKEDLFVSPDNEVVVPTVRILTIIGVCDRGSIPFSGGD